MKRFMPPAATVSASAPASADSVPALRYEGLITIVDQQRAVMLNAAATRLFGCPAAEMLGSDLSRFITPAPQAAHAQQVPGSHAAVRQGLSLALGTDAAAPVINERIARLDNQARDVEIALAALPDQGTTTLQLVISDVIDRIHLHRELQASRQALRRFTASLVEAREAERRHIARELHDELAQRLTAMKMALTTLGMPRTPGATDPPLDDLGLNAAIDWLANGWARRMDLSVSLTLGPNDPPVKESALIALYRILQEALTNVVRHSKASQVRVALRNNAEAVVLTVQDDGIGLPAHTGDQPGSHGLLGMRSRCQMLGSQFEIGNTPGGGVGVTVRLPLAAELPGQRASDAPQPTPSKSTQTMATTTRQPRAAARARNAKGTARGGAPDVAQGAHLVRGSAAPDAESLAHEAGRSGPERGDGMAGLRRGPTAAYLNPRPRPRPHPHPQRHRRVQADHSHPSAPASRTQAAVRGTKAIR